MLIIIEHVRILQKPYKDYCHSSNTVGYDLWADSVINFTLQFHSKVIPPLRTMSYLQLTQNVIGIYYFTGIYCSTGIYFSLS